MFWLLNEWEARCRTRGYELSLFVLDIMIMRMAHRGLKVLKPLMHEHDNQRGIRGTINGAHKCYRR
jgi:hypothetical protein